MLSGIGGFYAAIFGLVGLILSLYLDKSYLLSMVRSVQQRNVNNEEVTLQKVSETLSASNIYWKVQEIEHINHKVHEIQQENQQLKEENQDVRVEVKQVT